MHKKNSSPQDQLETESIADKIVEHPVAEWAKQNVINITLGVAVFLSLLFALYKMSSRDSLQSEADYYAAEKSFQLIVSDEDAKTPDPLRQDAFRELETILNNRPALNSKYDAPLAQVLIIENKANEAKPFAKRTFWRTEKNDLDSFTKQGKISLLVAEGNYEEALELSLELKATLLEEPEAYGGRENTDALLAYNLLQIAALQQQLGNAQEELTAWKAFKDYIFNGEGIDNRVSTQTSIMLQNLFAEGSATLKNYIEEREKTLK